MSCGCAGKGGYDTGVYNPCEAAVEAPGDACDPLHALGFVIERVVERGDSLVIAYGPIVDYLGVPVDFSNPATKAWFTIKRDLTRIDSQAEWQGTIGTGIVQETRGVLVVTIPPTATVNNVEGIEPLYYDLKAKDSAGRVATLEKGRISVRPGVTRATT